LLEVKPSSVHYLDNNIAIVGWACRLPGANSIDDLWSLLLEQRCAISQVPPDRFSLDRFGHPRRQEKGKSYTWAAGVLDDIWGFDPSAFGISPREAVQIDPQQRILLQLTWEALEDAGIRPSTVANSETGVFIGASQTDYGHAFFGDPAVADAHFATGTALAILANRISYVYGMHGPSIVTDTACSSSLVAMHQAIEAMRSGRIDTAIVGGSNLIASPASFIAFSQANMLSPGGLCRAFSAAADGFVRAEGAVVLVLRKVAHAHAQRNPIHGLLLATDVNSDGRTNGISLPNVDAQEALLRRLYARSNIDPDRLAFVEAHGTGTPVGDPAEATAIGRSIGRSRTVPLPIGSIKTNIGHLEPASGLAGVLKAVLALNHGILPASLHFEEPSPHIAFDELNINVCSQPLLLPKAADQYAGVNSFGFGGTNAHAVVAAGTKVLPTPVESIANHGDVFALSAGSDGALAALARHYADRVETLKLTDGETATLASAIVHRREQQPNRLVIASSRSEDVARALNAFVDGASDPKLSVGTAAGNELQVAFVYSGNGGQWAGMGVAAYRHNRAFRARFDEIDAQFKQVAGWSLKEALLSDSLADRLPQTSVVQPLIFAIQSASTVALREKGIEPAALLGHSIGEIAAAEAAGILDLRTAIKVIQARSSHQERTRGKGRMAAVLASPAKAAQLIQDIDGLEIAALNSPRAVTVAGAPAAIAQFEQVAKEQGVALLDLDLDYPFHTEFMAPLEAPLKADLSGIQVHDAATPFISTVTGTCIAGLRLDGAYWWRNIREPVQFNAAIQAAAELGARYFIEIGPRATLLKHITDSLHDQVRSPTAVAVLDRSDKEADPFDKARAQAMVAGARLHFDKIFGPDPGPVISLPQYPWQLSDYRLRPTVEQVGGDHRRHPLAGDRQSKDSLVWRSHVDTLLEPWLADHVLGEQTIFPGTGFVEIALAVAQQVLRSDAVIVTEFDVLNPLDLTKGETREILTQVSPRAGALEIMSRPRLSQAGWLLHCRCKFQAAAEGAAPPATPRKGETVLPESIYRIADASGLRYGPAFRLVENVVVHDDRFVSVALRPDDDGEEPRFLLDPMRLDAAAHGLFTVFPRLRAIERGVTYIPVRLEEVTLCKPHAVPARALIEITKASDHSIVANCYVYDADGVVVAVLRGARSQVISIKRIGSLESIAVVERPQLIDGTIGGETGSAACAADVAAAASAMTLAEGHPAFEPQMLLEGWAMAAAYEIAGALSGKDGVIDATALAVVAGNEERVRLWLTHILFKLEAAGLVERHDRGWMLIPDSSLPRAESVIKAIATEQPSYAAELLLAASITGFAKEIAVSGGVLPELAVGNAAFDLYTAASVGLRSASEALHRVLETEKKLWPRNRTLRVLQVGFAPITQLLLGSGRPLSLTLYEPDRRRFQAAELALSRHPEVRLLDAEHVHDLGEYDLVVSVAGLHRLGPGGLDRLASSLALQGLLAAVEPAPSFFDDMVFGLSEGWFSPAGDGAPVSRLRKAADWSASLASAGFRDSRAIMIGSGAQRFCLVCGDASVDESVAVAEHADDSALRPLVILASDKSSQLADSLKINLADRYAVSIVPDLEACPTGAPQSAVLFPGEAASDPVVALTQRCLDIKSCAERLDQAATLWLVFSGALAAKGAEINPVEAGAWAFSRTLANEFPKLDVRRIDIRPALPDKVAAARIARIMGSGTPETELQVDADAVRAVRVTGLKRVLASEAAGRAHAVRLERRAAVGERLGWRAGERVRPEDNEIEVEVEAAGLNFRDVMWSLSLLPEDMLEDGFSGATLGLECAGKVVRVGPGVKKFTAGDRVVAFAASSFATHVTINAGQAVKLPDGMPALAGATIPVAFFTAYYSLVEKAKLKRREWVVIHGGAGAVGMAAIQIAQWRGARVIATAGSPAKRRLLKVLGVDHVFDSRSISFVDDVRRVTKKGVDVVLNSLAGDAMERSIAMLRPFGRFVELGKRDYATNSHIGLRPFRKNLTYFGVDVDQVIGADSVAAQRTFAKILRQFENGVFTPLPYSVFDGEDVAAAFHLMQQSGHIGKIVVRPPDNSPAMPATQPFRPNAKGTHVITGAFGGFGLETAKWLVEKGARHLVMIGRSGPVSAEAQTVLREFAAKGIKILACSCDVTDRPALEELFGSIRSAMPPIAGVMHAAMALDDGILANLDVERFHRVLAPKVAGADYLDQLVRGEKLDYFVLFSSVTTLIGNPGQANYVAANAYMEGLARRRRQKGLPALAVGWGPILDVGVVARNQRLQSSLQKLSGASGLRARDALALLDQALALGARIPDAVMTISPAESSFAADRLPVLRSPTYQSYVNASRFAKGEGERVDLRALAAKEGVESARRKLVEIVSAQLAHVLHLRTEDISPIRPLGEIGLDSLMALELVMNLEENLGIRIPMSGASGALSVTAIANEIIAHLGLERDAADTMAAAIADLHHGAIETPQLETLKDVVVKEARTKKRLLS
jgi:acyl transferase domain-containing protein/NADPH:quinone reductase-like Zn-dependent oxidoreductase/NAD(P)-dependent dehydrogenase (short-subunit alcohol dehydrogenase family)/acyl carrier protein